MTEILSFKDYFHYYFSGMVWLIDLWLLVKNKVSFSEVTTLASQMPSSLVFIFILVIPFIVGFVFNPLGNYVAQQVLKIMGGDPVDWMLVLDGQSYKDNRHKKLAEPWRTFLLSKIKSLIGVSKGSYPEIKRTPFYWIRTFVDLKAPLHTRQRIERVLSLANLTESLLLPVPLLVLLGLRNDHCIVGVIFAAALFFTLSWRYRKLRIYWVQHVYRAFYFINNI